MGFMRGSLCSAGFGKIFWPTVRNTLPSWFQCIKHWDKSFLKSYFSCTFIHTMSILCAQTLILSRLLKNAGWLHGPLTVWKTLVGGYKVESWSRWRILSRGVTWEWKGQRRGRGRPGVCLSQTDPREEGFFAWMPVGAGEVEGCDLFARTLAKWFYLFWSWTLGHTGNTVRYIE